MTAIFIYTPPIKCFIKCVFFSSFFLSYKVQDHPPKTPNNVVIKWFPANEGKGMIGQIKVRIASLSALPNMTRRERPLSLLPLKHLPPRPSEGTVDPPALFRSLSCSWRFSQAGEGRGWVEGGGGLLVQHRKDARWELPLWTVKILPLPTRSSMRPFWRLESWFRHHEFLMLHIWPWFFFSILDGLLLFIVYVSRMIIGYLECWPCTTKDVLCDSSMCFSSWSSGSLSEVINSIFPRSFFLPSSLLLHWGLCCRVNFQRKRKQLDALCTSRLDPTGPRGSACLYFLTLSSAWSSSGTGGRRLLGWDDVSPNISHEAQTPAESIILLL